MSKPAIEIHGLGKQYGKPGSQADSLVGQLKNVFKPKEEGFWALRDIDLTVAEGESLGLIGPNGAGKSTLLKILSRITHPSAGRFTARGRITSLLEVGTGFHPELSGMENIFLNGSILGMSRQEIRASLDEIIDFSGVEDFIHMPVKHYSSGMKVRLAFSVAAHLTAEILLIDEVLAVGDAEFQRKCLGQMENATRKQGRTILFVSHNMRAVRDLCQRGIYIDHGQKIMEGNADEVTDFYDRSLSERALTIDLAEREDREGTGSVRLTSMRFVDEGGQPLPHLTSGEKAILEVTYEAKKPVSGLNLRLNVTHSDDVFLTPLSNQLVGEHFGELPASGTLRCTLDKVPFLTGMYSIHARLNVQNITTDGLRKALEFEVKEGDFYGSGDLYTQRRSGIYIPQKWEHQ